MGVSVRTNALLSSAFVLGACASPIAGDVEPLRDPDGPAMTVDAGAAPALSSSATPIHDVEPLVEIRCTDGFDPFMCNGRCAPGQGCCVSGIRPRGICTTSDECPIQCAIDCGGAMESRGAREGARCGELCVWLAPEPRCGPAL